MPFLPEPPFQHGQSPRTAILLINLGTPEAPTAAAVRPYLREFLSDPRVVEIPRAVWLPLLHGVILPLRSRSSAKKYASVWLHGDQMSGSPLLVHSERMAQALQQRFAAAGSEVLVACAMRYGKPSIASVLDALRAQGAERVLCLPLYPQYSGTTTATAFDAVFAALARMRNQPELRLVKHYHDHRAYIGALAEQVRAAWASGGAPDFAAGDRLLLSFHGVPRRTLDLGDPYHCECLKTGRLLTEALGLTPGQALVTFQSRFGKAEWLQPYTAPTLHELGRAGVGRVDVFCPGFPADCLETLEEIAMEGRDEFLGAGGREYRYIPCLNSSEPWIAALAEIAADHLHGWPQRSEPAALAASRAAALARGAPR